MEIIIYKFKEEAHRKFMNKKENTQLYLVYSRDFKLVEEGEVTSEKKKKFFRNFFGREFEHLFILSGAGTSIGLPTKTTETNKNEESRIEKSGLDRCGLWEELKGPIDKVIEFLKKKIRNLNLKEVKDNFDIEELLSTAKRYVSVVDNERGSLRKSISKIELGIWENCLLKLDKDSPHKPFLRKLIARRPNASRVKIFTTNYDTLWEQAASEIGCIVIDGFSFSSSRSFAGWNFDLDLVKREKNRIRQEECFIPNLIHLYKLHGSVNWYKDEKRNRVWKDSINRKAVEKKSSERPMMVFPSKEKYESSYEQPYFEMMSRFQMALRKENSLLVVLGFGFKDKHIQNVIIEAVHQNPSFHLVVLDYPGVNSKGIDLQKYEGIFGRNMGNVTLIHGTFSDFVENYPDNKAFTISDEADNV